MHRQPRTPRWHAPVEPLLNVTSDIGAAFERPADRRGSVDADEWMLSCTPAAAASLPHLRAHLAQ